MLPGPGATYRCGPVQGRSGTSTTPVAAGPTGEVLEARSRAPPGPKPPSPATLTRGGNHPDDRARAQSFHTGTRPDGLKDPLIAFTAPRATAPQGRSGKGLTRARAHGKEGFKWKPLHLPQGLKWSARNREDHLPHGQVGGSSSWSAKGGVTVTEGAAGNMNNRGDMTGSGAKRENGGVTRHKGHKGEEAASQG